MIEKKEIAFRDNTTTKELLPYSYVFYPGFYGTFFAFKENIHSDFIFCSCSKKAISNFIKLKFLKPKHIAFKKEVNFIFDSKYFPLQLVQHLMDSNLEENSSIINYLNFKNGLCHECNNAMPHYKYCHPMYGSSFKQNFGWYINKQAFEWGIEPLHHIYLENQIPEKIRELIKLDPDKTQSKIHKLHEIDRFASEKLRREFDKQKLQINNMIENEVRMKFGYKKIGDEWLNETILYNMIKSLMPDYKIKRHYRSELLDKLELDIYIPELKIGIEYQGIQHFKPVDHWGGVEGLKKVQERDKKKNELCKANGIRLIYFYYYEDITENLIHNKMGL